MSVQTFITDLQSSDPNRKFRWLVGLTIGTMAVIIGVWMIITPSAPPASGELIRKDDQPTFFGKVAVSAQNIIDVLRIKTANTINFFQGKLGTTNTIEVEITNN